MGPADLLDLSGRCAVVTGAAQGFGAAIAAQLAAAGATVVCADLQEDAAAERAEAIGDTGGAAVSHRVDVSDAAEVTTLMESSRQHTGQVDVLVNNAGVFSNYVVQNMPAEEFERVLRVNVVGTFLCCQAVVRQWLDEGTTGTIVNIASVDAMRGSAEGLSHYTTSKHAIAGLTRSLALELAPRGVRVNAVCPGAAMTEGAIELVTDGAPDGIDVSAQWDGIRERTPMGRLCEPEDVARAVLFLASEMASFVTGILLPVDGGMLIQPLEGYVPGDHTGEIPHD